MANYSNITLTKDGQAVLTQAIMSNTAQFTKVKTGSGVYAEGEVLSDKTDLKTIQQIIPITGVIRKDSNTILIRCVITNDGITEEYPINEIGLYAMNPETNTEVLFALVVASNPDYIIPFEQTPMSLTLELYMSLTDVADVTFSFELVEGIYATAEDLAAHTADNIRHVTSSERAAWNAKLNASATAVNSDKLDGYHANDFVYLANFSGGNLDSKVKYYTASIGKDCNDIDELIVVAIGAEGLHYPVANTFYYILTMKYSETEKKQVAFEYSGNKIYVRHSKGGIWYDWKILAMADEVLALTGGTVKGSNVTNLQLENTSNETSCVGFKGSTGHLGYLGMKGSNPVYITTGNAVNNLLHTGISSKVVVSETAPTDTTALWVW